MPSKSTDTHSQPSQQEATILALLWKQGPLSARQVLENMPDGKKRAYTSILSVLQVMEKKGFIRHEARGNTHFYEPILAEHEVVPPMLRRLVRNLFGGSPAAAVQNLLKATDADEDDLKELNRVIRIYKENQSNHKTK